jgi:uncharacterized protein
VIFMMYITLTGISRRVMRDLLTNRVRTIEIRSPQNFLAMIEAKPGDRLFLTEASSQDIVAGTNGTIASIMGIEIITHRTIQSGEDFYEEREAMAARSQLHLEAVGRVRRPGTIVIGEPLKIEVDEVRYCNAR